MLVELQASYTSKLLGLYDEQYEQGYWAGYVEGERVALASRSPWGVRLSRSRIPNPCRTEHNS